MKPYFSSLYSSLQIPQFIYLKGLTNSTEHIQIRLSFKGKGGGAAGERIQTGMLRAPRVQAPMGTYVHRTVPSRLAPTAKSRLVGMEGETLKGPVNDKVIIAKPLRSVANLQQTTYYTVVTRGV